MTGPHPAVAICRGRVRAALRFEPLPRALVIACSGGPDSLALAAAAAFVAPRIGVATVAVIVDHGLQPGSDGVAQRAAGQCRDVGIDRAEVRRVDVVPDGTGPEAAARAARYDVLRAAAREYGADTVLLGHTREDQAETVLLAMARGSGPRAVAGMAVSVGSDPRWLRPLLDVGRAETHAACEALGLHPWHDPHNDDRRYRRVRARRALSRLESDLGPGVVAGLARTAGLVRDDLALLDDVAQQEVAGLGGPPWDVARLAAMPVAVRSRVWRELITAAGAPAAALAKVHVDAVDTLVTDWHGQGPIDVPAGLRLRRESGLIHLDPRPVQ